jgi:hypothetical protein
MRWPVFGLYFFLASTLVGCASWFTQAVEGDTALDRPWMEIARESAEHPDQPFVSILRNRSVGLYQQMNRDSQFPFWMDLWGRSINFDEGARGIIVYPQILDGLIGFFEGPPRRDRIVHAGIEHTYGYLFSRLRTQFGFKRARWVEGEIEEGLGISVRMMSENASDGAFLSNVTYVLTSIALRDRQDVRPWLVETPPHNVHPAIVEWTRNEELGAAQRLTETVHIGSRQVEIRTDFITFHRGSRPRGNQALLIYSILDSDLEGGPRLISAFPVHQGFVDRVLDPERLGARQPISTRYNAFVAGVTDSEIQLLGERRVEVLWPRSKSGMSGGFSGR